MSYGNREWFWEGHIQQGLCFHLMSNGWTIVSNADTASKQRGIDIVAQKGGEELLIEVKGYPSTVYASGSKAGRLKPTQPTVQARHWYSHAVFSALLLLNKARDGNRHVALAFPDFPRYRSLITQTLVSLRKLGIGVFLVSEAGAVETVL
jgi:Holliday junction resolvase-like predicted endonuclease